MRAFIPVFAVIVLFFMRDAQAETPLEKLSCEELVERLASANPCPGHPVDGNRPQAPTEYLTPRQNIVYEAWNELLKREANEALPALIAHFDDRRYSCTHDLLGFGWRNESVADVCRETVRWRLNFYVGVWAAGSDPRGMRLPDYCNTHLYKKEDAEAWLEKRRKSTWRDLQIEACLFFLDEEGKTVRKGRLATLGRQRVEDQLEKLKVGEAEMIPRAVKPLDRF